VFQGSMTVGSVLWGASAERTSLAKALLASGLGIAACLLLRLPFPLPEPIAALDVWNHWPKPTMFTEPEPDEGPVLVTIEYKVDPDKAQEFLEAIHKYQRIRRRDGATRWGVYYDAEFPGKYLETFLVDSWAEHQRQHDRITLADRTIEEQVFRYALEPVPKVQERWIVLSTIGCETSGKSPAKATIAFFAVLDRDAHDSLAAVELVLIQPTISSQLIDKLNASIHLRALLMDLFLLSEIVKTQRTSAKSIASGG
jgi:hypothetical protein